MRQLLVRNEGRRLRSTAELARVAKTNPRHTSNIRLQEVRPPRSREFKRDVSLRRAKVSQAAPQEVLLDTRKAQPLSLILHAITLTAFAGIASFGLDFIFMIGQRWGFVIGVLLYLSLCAVVWNIDRAEQPLPSTADEKLALRPSSRRRVFDLRCRSRGRLYLNEWFVSRLRMCLMK